MSFSFDTNILVYACEPHEDAKHKLSLDLLRQGLEEQWVLPTQVLGEFYSVAVRKRLYTRAQAQSVINDWSKEFTIVSPSVEAFHKALDYAARTGTQFWDALILATCAQHGVKKLYTEDIGAQTQAMGVKLIDPFIKRKPAKK